MVLIIIKYFGLCLAAVSSVWGTINNLTAELPNGKKRLTRAGVVSVALTIIGLATSILSEDLQRRNAAAEQSNKIAAQAKRTNQIIISAQPLTSLALSLQFESPDEQLRKEMADGDTKISENAKDEQGGVETPYDTMEYEAHVIPLLKYLAHLGTNSMPHEAPEEGEQPPSRTDEDSVFALMPLDDSPNAVLSFGQLSTKASWDTSDGSAALSAGFTPVNLNTRKSASSPNVEWHLDGNSNATYILKWDLDPVTLNNSIDQQVEDIRPTAKLPLSIKIAVFHGGDTLPFATNNFALSQAVNLWKEEDPGTETNMQKVVLPMELSLRVNGFNELVYNYKLQEAYRSDLHDDYDDYFEFNCTILKFALEKM